MLALAAAARLADAAGGPWWLHWLALHLALLGGVSQLVLGAGQFFACAFLATDPPPKRLVRAQLGCWNSGTVLVAVGVPTGWDGPTDAGALLILAGLVLFAASLERMRRRSLQSAPWAVRWYMACAACLALGAIIGALLARGTAWSHGSLLGSHMALNLGGWLGTAIVGTLHTFFPSLTQTRLRFQRLQPPTFWLWLAGVATLAGAAAFGSTPALVAGWLVLLLAAGCLSVNLIASLRAAEIVLGLPARLLALAQCFLVAGLAVALGATVDRGFGAALTGHARGALAVLLVAGWIGLTVAGALLHLLAVVARVRQFALAMPVPRPQRDRALVVAAAVAVTALALARGSVAEALEGPAAALLVAVAVALAAQAGPLAWRALRPLRGVGAPGPGARRPARVVARD